MMRARPRRFALLLLAAGVLALAGCMSVADPTKYYVLSPATPREPLPAASASSVAVGVGPVLIPGYLDRVQIVTRDANDGVSVAMYDRWAEPLESGIGQVLADNLGAQMGSERIAVFPWRGESRACSTIRWPSSSFASRAGPAGRRPWTHGGVWSARTVRRSP